MAFFNISGAPHGIFDFFLSWKMEFRFPNELWRDILEIKANNFKRFKRCQVCHYSNSKYCTYYRCTYCSVNVCELGVYECFLCKEILCFRHHYYYNYFKESIMCRFCWEDFDREEMDLDEIRRSPDLAE